MGHTHIIAKEGWNQIIVALMVFLFFYTISFVSWIFFAILLFTIFIYRNPERILDEEDELSFVAPIDGKIIDISKVNLRDGSEMLSVVIKKSIWNVGIMRAPMAMSIVEVKKRFGLFLPSTSPLFASLDEKNTLTCKGKFASIKMIMNAGWLSQRIALFDLAGILKVGQRFAFLNDGEVTLLLPLDARIKVSLGDEVKSGVSVLGYFAYKAKNDK